jgi:hypothetical protein
MLLQAFVAEDGLSTEFKDWRAFQSSRTNIWKRGLLVHKHTIPPLRKGHYVGAVIDAPWTYHAPKLIVWCADSFPSAATVYCSGHEKDRACASVMKVSSHLNESQDTLASEHVHDLQLPMLRWQL